jgi:bla regulator protein blaR1
MSALFSPNWLIDTAAAVTLLIALVLLLRGPVTRAFGASFAYALWLLPLARAVLPTITLSIEAPPLPAVSQDIIMTMAAAPVAVPFDPVPWLAALWLGGALALTGHAAIAYARLRRAILADSVQVASDRRIAILSSGAVDGPVALGLFRPLVALPLDFATRFTPAEQEQVLAHELEHHRGHDLAINLAAFGLLALNWFNPISWAGWRAFRQDQEAACDARTLARTGGDRATYGRAIAAAVAGPSFRPAGALALAMGQKSALIHRLRSLGMKNISQQRRWAGRAALVGAALVALPLTATVSYAVVQADAQPTPPTPPTPPTEPAPPTPPTPPRVIVVGSGEDASMTERRIERDGRTIIVRSAGAGMSDAEVDRIVAEALADDAIAQGGATANTSADGTRRVVVVRRSSSNTTSSSSGQSASSSSSSSSGGTGDDQPVNSSTTFVFRHDGAAGQAVTSTSCDDDPTAQRIARTRPANGGQLTLRVIRCGGGDAPTRLEVLRQARRSMAAMPEGGMPAEARTAALAELDELIAEAERGGN